MARLETQINQIYLVNPEAKKTSLLLYEESLSTSAHLFVLSELANLQKKSANLDLKRISEIILESFRQNKKLSGELLFESALAQINQNLADLAHGGRKSWVGKFSCLIGVKIGNNIFLANSGPASAWLRRGSELLEILPGEKRGDHPLKTFTNFTQGKLLENDQLILTASNIFNYISSELFQKILNGSDLGQASMEISRIVKESTSPEQGFGAFLLEFNKNFADAPVETPIPVYVPIPEDEIEMKPRHRFALPTIKLPSLSLPGLRSFNFPKIKLPHLEWQFFRNLSRPGKFLFISFAVCLSLFIINLSIYGLKLHGKSAQAKLDILAQHYNQALADGQSALIYKNDRQAIDAYATAAADLVEIEKINSDEAANLEPSLNELKILVNKISVVPNPTTVTELKHQPIFMVRDGKTFIFSGTSSNSLSKYDGTVKDYFLLNSIKSDINGLSVFSPAGLALSTADQIYYINAGLKQFESAITFPDANLASPHGAGSTLLVMNKADGKISKITFSKNKYAAQVIASDDLAAARDFGTDKDVYVLFADQLHKITGGQVQSFPLPPMTDAMTNADRIVVASNLYILEANKKRLIIMNKSGVLQNQFYFPSTTNINDISIDEAGRNIYLLDDNKLLRITF